MEMGMGMGWDGIGWDGINSQDKNLERMNDRVVGQKKIGHIT